MKVRFFTAPLIAVALGVAPSLASAQQQTNQLERVRSFQTAPGVTTDSRQFFPQIKDAPRATADRPENPPPPPNAFQSETLSNIIPGGIGNYQRSIPKSRFPGIGATGWEPPDPNLAVGPNHVVSVVNSDVAWFNKTTGVKLFQQGMDGSGGWFGTVGATDFVFDPKCWFDKVSGRYFVLALELVQTAGSEASKLLIAVSDDSDPTGNWFMYRIEAKLTVGSDTFWMDYPSLATNKDGVAVCGNMFGLTGNSGWAGVQFIAMKKAAMLTGGATTVTSLRDPGAGSAQVARMTDPNLNHIYAIALGSNAARVYAIQNFQTTPTITFQSATIPGYVGPSRNATSTAGRSMDSIDTRPFNCAYQGGKIVAVHNTDVSGSNNKLTPRWYQLNTNNWPIAGLPTLAMTGIIPGAGVDHWMPAIGINSLGDVSVIFSRASTNIIADVMIASRKANDTPGTMGNPVKLDGSVADYGGPGGHRWGDYFDVAIDPNDNLKFWGIGMVSSSSGNWQTVIHSWTVSTPANTAGSFDALVATMFDGTLTSGVTTDVHAVDSNLFLVNSRYQARLGSIAAIELTYDVGAGGQNIDFIGLNYRQTTTLGTTGMWWLWNWTTNKYDHISSWQQATNMAATATVSTRKNLPKYVGPDGTVKVVVRTTTRPSISSPYTLKADQLQLIVNVVSGP